MNRLNDWIKVLLVHLGGGMLTLISFGISPLLGGMSKVYLRVGFAILTLIYYNFMGIYLRKVKVYKVFIVYIGAFIVAFLMQLGIKGMPSIITTFLAGGTFIFMNVWKPLKEFDKYLWEARHFLILASFGVTYLGVLISRLSLKASEKEALSEKVAETTVE